MWDETYSDPILVPLGSVTRARAKKFKDAFMGLIRASWSQAIAWRPIEGIISDNQHNKCVIQLLLNKSNLSRLCLVAFKFDLSNGSSPPFVAPSTIPRFLFAGEHWVAVFYTKVRVTIQAMGRGSHPNLIVERSWRLLRLRVSSQVGVVRIRVGGPVGGGHRGEALGGQCAAGAGAGGASGQGVGG
ncbi:hypothetical protein TIFTF001_039377 [Ficus carica]|uniref:Uncharacterized protein n=1 Tax=Ficus carica TaxID=3494 RepID=A0AA88EJI6_FICCA|nr:hypothetical protein TIFTF001_039377 [Ficus carica]